MWWIPNLSFRHFFYVTGIWVMHEITEDLQPRNRNTEGPWNHALLPVLCRGRKADIPRVNDWQWAGGFCFLPTLVLLPTLEHWQRVLSICPFWGWLESCFSSCGRGGRVWTYLEPRPQVKFWLHPVSAWVIQSHVPQCLLLEIGIITLRLKEILALKDFHKTQVIRQGKEPVLGNVNL
jgi:hypothetical protein